MRSKFKNNHALEERKQESSRIMSKYPYPERIPIIYENYEKNIVSVPTLDKTKYIFSPMDLTVDSRSVYVCTEEMYETATRSSWL